WFIQELIAPRELRFFAADWTDVGSRSERLDEIFKITSIDPFVLAVGWDPGRVLAARRMFWASRRQTARSEDMAYCLLGLFDVTMPIVYNEGLENAFIRLQYEISKRTGDLSFVAWQSEVDWKSTSWVFDPSVEFAKKRDILARSPVEFRQCGFKFSPWRLIRGRRLAMTW
ncbi:hypothetical protein B0H66DRAFT_484958, partial [Apodospora peruviana]